jgi:hypothetical protein
MTACYSMTRLPPTGPKWLTYAGLCFHIVWCNVKGVVDREILETYLNSAPKNTSETDLYLHRTKSFLTSIIITYCMFNRIHVVFLLLVSNCVLWKLCYLICILWWSCNLYYIDVFHTTSSWNRYWIYEMCVCVCVWVCECGCVCVLYIFPSTPRPPKWRVLQLKFFLFPISL